MKLQKQTLIISIAISLILLSFSYLKFINTDRSEEMCGKYETGEVFINGTSIKTFVADDYCKLSLGLSGKKAIKDDEGMLFVFEKPGNYGFWMKDMKFPIDIIWISKDFSVIGIEKNLKPETYPKIFGRDFISKYVLEVRSGFSDENEVKIGEPVKIF